MDWAGSPFVIPVAVFAMVLGIVIVVNIANYHNRKLKSEERMAAIAKGIPLPPEPEPDYTALAHLADRNAATSLQRARGLRTGGVVLISIGVGLVVFSFCLEWILQERDVLAVAAAGLIPLAIGVGLLVDYALRNRTLRQEGN
jgi:hydrogenase-4 membrane subunit HyfE